MFGRSLDAFRGFRRPVYAIAVGRLVNVFGSGLVYPFASVHFHLEVGISLSLVGLGLLANNVATATGTALGGYLADRYGRRPVMVWSMALSTLSLSAYALVHTAGQFIAVATAAGLTVGLYAPASQAMTADLTDAGERERGYALLKVASNAGFGMGFVVGGVLYAVASTAIFVADGLTSGAVAVTLLVALPRIHEGRPAASLTDSVAEWRQSVTRPRILALAVLNVGFATMYAQMQATVPVVAAETLSLSSAQIGTLYVLNPAVIVLFQMPLVAAITSWRRTRGLVVSAGLWALSFLAVMAVPGVPRLLGVALVGAFLVVRTAAEILHSPLTTSLASDLGKATERGSQLSLIEIAKRLGMGIGAAVGGAFFDYGLQHVLWPVLVGICVVIALGALALERRLSPAENGSVPVEPSD